MKVLHVVATGQRRGGEIFASDLSRYLKDQGLDQRILVIRNSGIEVEFGVPVVPSATGRTDKLASLPALRAIRRQVGSWRPDVIQAHGGEAMKHVVMAGVANRTCVVYRRIGGSPGSLASSRIRKRAYAELMTRTRRVVTVAEALRAETIAAFKLPEEQVVTIPNAVDARRLQRTCPKVAIRKDLDIRPDQKILLSVGALAVEKDPDAHLSVAESVMAHDSRAVYVVAGDGPMRDRIEREASRRGLTPRCRFLGRRTDIGDLMSVANALLFAGRPDGMEGMPAVLIEAAMVGLPVVAFDVAGVSEVVMNGETGFVIPWRNITGLAEAALQILEDEERAARFGETGEALAAGFGIEVIGERYVDLYRSLVA